MSFKIRYEDQLNEAQLKAVEIAGGPVLVIAGAGSGKTRTLVYRVARLLEEGIAAEQILLLTFTRRAADSMLKMASLLLDERCGKVSGRTFHSFANAILRRYASLVGFNHNFTILDRSDSEDVINLIRARLGFHKDKFMFPKKRAILNVISKSINKGCGLEDVLEEDYPQFIQTLDDLKKIREEYRDYKKTKSLLDYDDLLIYLKVLLEENDDLRARLSNFYRYIMVDEYQDTNKLQARIAYLLASEHQNIMVVGDDSQSIYSFRGANFRNIMDFPKIFPKAKIITLEQNYRSTQPILNLTNGIIKYAKEKYSKTLFAEKKGNQKPLFVQTPNENYQSRFIVQRVLELREEGIPLNDLAILFRAGWHSNDLEIELASHNIPFVKYGGLKFTEAAHIKDVTACLKVAFNPLDSVGWLRILLLIEGIGSKTAGNIILNIVDHGKGLGFLNEDRFSKKKYREDLKSLFSTLTKIQSKEIRPADQVKILLKFYRPYLEQKYDDFNKRINDLDSLSRIAERYNKLERFLSDMTLEPLGASQVEAGAKEEERLVLSTIHSAKGLQWQTVFIIFCIDGYLPSFRSLDNEENVEEERRLFYVAATRAKENLYLMRPQIEYTGRGSLGFSKVSRFLEEGDILEEYVEEWGLADLEGEEGREEKLTT